jgi:hypothetical protein
VNDHYQTFYRLQNIVTELQKQVLKTYPWIISLSLYIGIFWLMMYPRNCSVVLQRCNMTLYIKWLSNTVSISATDSDIEMSEKVADIETTKCLVWHFLTLFPTSENLHYNASDVCVFPILSQECYFSEVAHRMEFQCCFHVSDEFWHWNARKDCWHWNILMFWHFPTLFPTRKLTL